MYVDDLVPGSNTIEELEVIKQKSTELSRKAGSNLHKWHSNIPSLQSSNTKSLKVNFLVPKKNFKTQPVLQKYQEYHGIKRRLWHKCFPVNFANFCRTVFLQNTSRRLLLERLFIVSYVIRNLFGDTETPQTLNRSFKKWVNDITNIPIEIARSIPTNKESITSADPHVFKDAIIIANCAAVYAVVNQFRAISQGPVAGKSRISKRDLTNPRLELM